MVSVRLGSQEAELTQLREEKIRIERGFEAKMAELTEEFGREVDKESHEVHNQSSLVRPTRQDHPPVQTTHLSAALVGWILTTAPRSSRI